MYVLDLVGTFLRIIDLSREGGAQTLDFVREALLKIAHLASQVIGYWEEVVRALTDTWGQTLNSAFDGLDFFVQSPLFVPVFILVLSIFLGSILWYGFNLLGRIRRQ